MSEQSEEKNPVTKPENQGRRLTYYDVLDLDRDATEEEVKAAYRQLAREHHPDVAKDDPAVGQKFAATPSPISAPTPAGARAGPGNAVA